MTHTRTWTEAGQPFVREGLCIRTLKPSTLKLAYGDDRLRDRQDPQQDLPRGAGRLKRAITFFLPLRAPEPPNRADLS